MSLSTALSGSAVLSAMACRITELVLDARNPEALSGWWCAVLGWVEVGREIDDSITVGPRAGTGTVPTLVFNRSTDAQRDKLPLHLDLSATDRDQRAELERLLELGARPADVGQTGREPRHVLADPEGNAFCLLAPTVEPV